MPIGTVPVTFTPLTAPPGFSGNTQDLLNLINEQLADSLAVQVNSGGVILGGTAPTSDLGPWLPTGKRELWVWDPAFLEYFPSGGPPVGSIVATTSENPPGDNYLECNGSIKLQLGDYRRLFAYMQHNAALNNDDATALQLAGTFRLPDLRGRVIVGAGHGPGLTERFKGNLIGLETVLLLPSDIPPLDIDVTGNSFSDAFGSPSVPGPGGFRNIVSSFFTAGTAAGSDETNAQYINTGQTQPLLIQPGQVWVCWIRY